MPNKETHFTIAFILLVIIYFLMNYLSLVKYFGFATILLIGSILPDMIEPAYHYTHRKYFHSKSFLKILYIILLPLLIISIFLPIILYLLFLIIGYILHLWLDATTKMGLPN